MPSLIVIELESESVKACGLFDPGSNISTVTKQFLGKRPFVPRNIKYRTMSGEGNIIGETILNVKMKDIQKRVNIFVNSRKK